MKELLFVIHIYSFRPLLLFEINLQLLFFLIHTHTHTYIYIYIYIYIYRPVPVVPICTIPKSIEMNALMKR